ncbi:MAG TPA: GNAT family N-acetyltransferase [Allosphingosinicella sp.]|nr:GNAT family N-acetyltransferase [Allosphingosinicella sp.]
MSVEVELFDDLAAAEADAAGALGREAQASIYDRLSWYRLLAAHVDLPGKPIIARARHMQRRAWIFLATGDKKASAWASWYSLRWRPIGEPELWPHILAAFRDGLVPELDLAPIEDPAPVVKACRESGWIPFVEEAKANWIADTTDMDFETYWAKRPSKLRNSAKRKAKAAGLDIAIHRRFDEAAWADYEEVYAASWKPEEGSMAFLRALAEQEGAAGTLRLGVAKKDGKPLAAQLWLVENGEATIHKLAYREDAKALSPGTILSMAMFRSALDEDRVARIDYGTGDEPYKADWMGERRMLWRVRAYNRRTLTGLLKAARRKASSLVARRVSR